MAIIKKVDNKNIVLADTPKIDHSQLSGTNSYGAHPISAIRKLPEKLSALKKKDEEIDSKIEDINEDIAEINSDIKDLQNKDAELTNNIAEVKRHARQISINYNEENKEVTFTNYDGGTNSFIVPKVDEDTLTYRDTDHITLKKVYVDEETISGLGTSESPLEITNKPDELTIITDKNNAQIYAGAIRDDAGVITPQDIRDANANTESEIERLDNKIDATKEQLEEVNSNQQDQIDDLLTRTQGMGGYLNAYDFETAIPTQEELTQYAIQDIGNITSQSEIYNGTKVKNLYDNHIWVFNDDPELQNPWSDQGTDAIIADANNDGLHGLVTGSEEDYYGSIDSLGRITINKLEEDLNSIDSDLNRAVFIDGDQTITGHKSIDNMLSFINNDNVQIDRHSIDFSINTSGGSGNINASSLNVLTGPPEDFDNGNTNGYRFSYLLTPDYRTDGFYPIKSNADLGFKDDSGNIDYWRNLYLSGKLSDGTNETTIEEIVDNYSVITLVGTEEDPINLYTDTEPNKFYFITGHIIKNLSTTMNFSTTLLFYKHQYDGYDAQSGVLYGCHFSNKGQGGSPYSSGTEFNIYPDGTLLYPQPFYTIGSLNGPNASYGSPPNIYAPTSSGTTGQILQSNGVNRAPTWVDSQFTRLVGTQENPINFATQMVTGRLYSCSGHFNTTNESSEGSIAYNKTIIIGSSNPATYPRTALVYKISDTEVVFLHTNIGNNSVSLAIVPSYYAETLITFDSTTGNIVDVEQGMMLKIINGDKTNLDAQRDGIYVPLTSGEVDQILVSQGEGKAPVWQNKRTDLLEKHSEGVTEDGSYPITMDLSNEAGHFIAQQEIADLNNNKKIEINDTSILLEASNANTNYGLELNTITDQEKVKLYSENIDNSSSGLVEINLDSINIEARQKSINIHSIGSTLGLSATNELSLTWTNGDTQSNTLALNSYGLLYNGQPITTSSDIEKIINNITLINHSTNSFFAGNITDKQTLTSESTGRVIIGNNARSNSQEAIVIGDNAHVNGSGSISIGSDASVSVTNAIQLGAGQNSNANTFQVFNYQLLDESGFIPEERLEGGLPTVEFIA